jgi:hypothetical protein
MGLISPAIIQNPFSFFLNAFTTSFTPIFLNIYYIWMQIIIIITIPLLTIFALDAFLTNL